MRVKDDSGKVFKVGRNDPCPCKSGRKFKKCCLPKMRAEQAERKVVMDAQEELTVAKQVLKNEFREEAEKEGKSLIEIETEKVGEAEMLQRDTYVTMRQLQAQRDMLQRDQAYNKAGYEAYEQLVEELESLPLSEAKLAVGVMIAKQMEQLSKQIAQCEFAGVNIVTLAALEHVMDAHNAKTVAKPTEVADDPTPTTEPEDSDADMDKYDNENNLAGAAADVETAEELKDD